MGLLSDILDKIFPTFSTDYQGDYPEDREGYDNDYDNTDTSDESLQATHDDNKNQ